MGTGAYSGEAKGEAGRTPANSHLRFLTIANDGQDTRAIQHYLDHRVTDFGARSVQRLLERLIRISSALDLATAAKLTEPGTKLQPLALLSFLFVHARR